MVGLIMHSGCALFNAAEQEVIRIDANHDRRIAEKANAMGLHWLDYGDNVLATHAFEKAIAADSRYGPAHNNLGQIYFDALDMYQAAIAFDRAAQLMPDNPIPQNNLGLALETGGKLEQAIGHYQRAHELDPTNAEFLGNLIRVRMRLDPWDESVVGHLQELLFIETRPEWIEWVQEQLEIRHNPMLDRGPPGPDLSGFGDRAGETADSNLQSDRIIEEVPPLGELGVDEVPGTTEPEFPWLPPADELVPSPAPRESDTPPNDELMRGLEIHSPSRVTLADDWWSSPGE